ncbi:peptidoglycan-binding protein [Salipaludibacillus daqingensis]|uniref:peptidoglycan-binding protein n=1 Tax=Salipaludibacillus daqingensis TaxID=3041001 RepID=UPI002474D9D0|nr:peptidoglycan-binding protein [Salipaludibacillus daqingensis]
MNKLFHLTTKCIATFLFIFTAFVIFDSSSTAANEDQTFGDKLLGNGKVHSHVTELQDLLDQRGYLEDRSDVKEGVFDDKTKASVLSFQKDADIYIDGLAGEQTIGALKILREGDEGNVVLYLQEDLQQLGYYQGALDGKFGPLTYQAVIDFQTEQEIAIDGLAGPETYGALHEAILGNRSQQSSQSTSSSHSSSSSNSGGSENTESSEDSGATEQDSASIEQEDSGGNDKGESEQSEQEESSSSNDESSNSSTVEGKVMTMEATAYTAYCEGCSGITYTGLDLRNNPHKKVIAVDPNVIPLGSKVYVEGYGEAIAGDIGGAIKGHRIDLFMPDRDDALEFGRKDVEITVLE